MSDRTWNIMTFTASVSTLLLLVFWLALGAGVDPLVQQGTTNFDSMSLSGNLTVAGTSALTGNLSDSGGAFTIADNVLIDGAADAEQLVVQGNATQTSDPLVVEQSDGTNVFTVSNAGNVLASGTADIRGNVSDGGGVFTVADNVAVTGQADAIQLTVTGFTTQTNSLLVLEQTGGTDVVTVSNAGNVDAAGTLQYGANNLYPVGYGASGQQLVYGTATITGTAVIAHGLTTVTFCQATLGEDPTAGAGEAAHVTVTVAANVCTAKVWQDDFVTAATEANVVVHWLVIGAP